MTTTPIIPEYIRESYEAASPATKNAYNEMLRLANLIKIAEQNNDSAKISELHKKNLNAMILFFRTQEL